MLPEAMNGLFLNPWMEHTAMDAESDTAES
jgi:hypothetical protein